MTATTKTHSKAPFSIWSSRERQLKFLLGFVLIASLVFLWNCSSDSGSTTEVSETTSETKSTASGAAEPMLAWRNTGLSNDAYTTDATVTVTAGARAEVVLAVETNGTNHATDDPVSITMPAVGQGFESDETSKRVDLLSQFGLTAPTGTEKLEIKLTATSTELGKAEVEADPITFTLVEAIPSTVTLTLEEDTGLTNDKITTNASVVVGGTIPDGATLSFSVMTNGTNHTPATAFVATAAGLSQTNDLLGTATETLSVSVVASLVRDNGHTNVSNLSFTLFNWPTTAMVGYDDTGSSDSDGITTSSVLEFSGIDALEATNLKLASYKITNTDASTETNVPIPTEDQLAFSSEYEVDLRRVKSVLGDDERVNAVGIDYAGHTVTQEIDTDLRYEPALYKRKFELGASAEPEGLAITSNDVAIVAFHNNHHLKFYDAMTGDPTNLMVDHDANPSTPLMPSATFGGRGAANHQFNQPNDVAVDDEGLIYVADGRNARLQIFNPDFSLHTNILAPVRPGNGHNISYVHRLHLEDGWIYINRNKIEGRYIATYTVDGLEEGRGLGFFGVGDDTDWEVMAIDLNGVYHVVDLHADRIWAWTGSPETGFARTEHSHRATNDGTGPHLTDIVVGPKTGRLYVIDEAIFTLYVLEYDPDASPPYTLIANMKNPGGGGRWSSANGHFHEPKRMVIHKSQLYIAEEANQRVQVFDVPE